MSNSDYSPAPRSFSISQPYAPLYLYLPNVAGQQGVKAGRFPSLVPITYHISPTAAQKTVGAPTVDKTFEYVIPQQTWLFKFAPIIQIDNALGNAGNTCEVKATIIYPDQRAPFTFYDESVGFAGGVSQCFLPSNSLQILLPAGTIINIEIIGTNGGAGNIELFTQTWGTNFCFTQFEFIFVSKNDTSDDILTRRLT